MPIVALVVAAAALVPQPAVAVRPLAGMAAVERQGGFVLVRGSVAGHPATIMLDNGAERSLVDRRFAEAAGLAFTGPAGTARTVNGRVAFRQTRPAALMVDGVLDARLPLAALDLSALGRVAGRRIDAILGADLLARVRLALDARALRVADAAPPAGSVTHTVSDPPKLPVRVAGATLLLMLDLGYHGALSVTPAAWTRIAPRDAPTYAAHTAGVDGVAAAIQVSRLPGFSIGTVEIGPAEIEIGRQPARAGDGLIGSALLDHVSIVLDLGRKTILLVPRPGGGSVAGELP